MLGNNGQNDKFELSESTLLQDGNRRFDGGTGTDTIILPYKDTRPGDGEVFRVVNDRVLQYDTRTGATDVWETVGTFYRTEKVIYSGLPGFVGDFADLIA